MSSDQGHWSRTWLVNAPNSGVGCFELFGLQPCVRQSAPVAAVGTLRDDSIEPDLLDGAEERQRTALEMLTVLDPAEARLNQLP
jgi:hypothetical protein